MRHNILTIIFTIGSIACIDLLYAKKVIFLEPFKKPDLTKIFRDAHKYDISLSIISGDYTAREFPTERDFAHYIVQAAQKGSDLRFEATGPERQKANFLHKNYIQFLHDLGVSARVARETFNNSTQIMP